MIIWILNPFDELPGEGSEGRFACISRHLAQRGHEVTWISSDFHHRKKEKRSVECRVTSDECAARQTLPGRFAPFRGGPRRASTASTFDVQCSTFDVPSYSLLLIPTPPYRSNTSLQRLASHRVWAKRLRQHLLEEVRSELRPAPDLILASTPPLEGAEAAMRLGKELGTRVVVDFMDDWPATWLQALPSNPLIQAAGRMALSPWFRLARRLFANADAVSAQSHTFARRATALGHTRPVHVCYLGGQPLPPLENAASSSFSFHLVYLGAMGRLYDLETLLRTMRLAKERGQPWGLSLAGTDPEGRWQKRRDELGLEDRVHFTGFLQRGELHALLSSAHVGIVPMDPASGVAVPYKAGDYLAYGLPVISSLPGELQELLEASGAGRHYRFGDPDDLYRVLSSAAADTNFRIQAPSAAQNLFERYFNRERTYPDWAQWLESL